MKTYHWDVLATFHWDVVGCFIWDVPATLLGRTKRRCNDAATTSRCWVGRLYVVVYIPSFALSECQHPWILNSLSFTPAFPAADTPPERKLCNENSSLSMHTVSFDVKEKFSQSCLWQWNIFYSQCPVLVILWLVIDLNINSLEFPFIFAMWRYLCNVTTGHNSELPLLSILLSTYSFTISKMESKNDFILKSIYVMLIPNRFIYLFIYLFIYNISVFYFL